MNSIMTERYPLFQMYQALRDQLMHLLSDDDLQYRPTENNPTLGTLCREIGETERSYIESFRTWQQDFSYRHPDAEVETSVAKLSAWFGELDQELKEALESLSEDDLKNRVVDRGGDFKLPPHLQLEVYKEALLIFYGKASVYLHAMGKPLPEQWQHWIG